VPILRPRGWFSPARIRRISSHDAWTLISWTIAAGQNIGQSAIKVVELVLVAANVRLEPAYALRCAGSTSFVENCSGFVFKTLKLNPEQVFRLSVVLSKPCMEDRMTGRESVSGLVGDQEKVEPSSGDEEKPKVYALHQAKFLGLDAETGKRVYRGRIPTVDVTEKSSKEK
jgi:hypothetical protein